LLLCSYYTPVGDKGRNEWMNEEIQENRINTKKSGGTLFRSIKNIRGVGGAPEENQKYQKKFRNIRRSSELSEEFQKYRKDFWVI
jgi:hypothetical protein